MRRSLGAQEQQPSAGGEEKSETIGTTGNVIDRRAMHGVHHPHYRHAKSNCGQPRNAPLQPRTRKNRSPVKDERAEELAQQKIKRHATAGMQEHVRDMKAPRVRVPKKVIEHVGDGLDRAVMGRKGIEEQIVPKSFQDQQRAFDEWIIARQINVVPNALALQSWSVDHERRDKKSSDPKPALAQVSDSLANANPRHLRASTLWRRCFHFVGKDDGKHGEAPRI